MNPYEAPQTDTANPLSRGRPPIASVGKRFANYLIDQAIIYGLIRLVSWLLISYLSESSLQSLAAIPMIDYLLSYLTSYLCYVAMEAATGRSFGKLITGTKVLTKEYLPASFGQILGRSLVRFIPFEPFSMLSAKGVWHDTMSGTIVVDTRAKELPPPRIYIPGERPTIIHHPASSAQPGHPATPAPRKPVPVFRPPPAKQ
jgi:uncharacterized RDD family membrane protein YckC